jgi:hypothetical protein
MNPEKELDEMYIELTQRKMREENLRNACQTFAEAFTKMREYPDDGDGLGGIYWIELLEAVFNLNPNLQKDLGGSSFENYIYMTTPSYKTEFERWVKGN